MLVKFAILLITAPLAFCASCESPKYSSSGFSTLDGFFHFSTTYIVEFSLQCSNNVRDVQFYAVINGKTYAVATSEETSKYQVSWQLDHPSSGQQTFNINVYDEEKYNDYKKAVQNGGDGPAVSPLFTLNYYHSGVWKKSPISPELVFLFLGAGAFYYATIFKNQFRS